MEYQEVRENFNAIWRKLLLKIQKLPKAEPVETVAFSIIILFIVTILIVVIISCCSCCPACCCNRSPDHKGRRIHVEPVVEA